MRLLITIFVLTSLLFSCGISKLERNGVYKEVDASDYLLYVSDSSINLIDVRTASEYAKNHIQGAKNASYFSGHFKSMISSLNLDTTKTTLIYCETQHRSLFVVKKLYKLGFKSIVDLDRGMLNWRKSGFPYETE